MQKKKLETLGRGERQEEDDGGSRQKEKELMLWVQHGKSLALGFLEVALGSVLSTGDRGMSVDES